MTTHETPRRAKDYEVVKFYGTGAIKRRIMDMGITKGNTSPHPESGPSGRPCGNDCTGL